jgi:hypothetical protein
MMNHCLRTGPFLRDFQGEPVSDEHCSAHAGDYGRDTEHQGDIACRQVAVRAPGESRLGVRTVRSWHCGQFGRKVGFLSCKPLPALGRLQTGSWPGSEPTACPLAREGPSVASEAAGEARPGQLREPHVGVGFGSRGRGCQRL